jgi:hypothetical protein
VKKTKAGANRRLTLEFNDRATAAISPPVNARSLDNK